jgi:flavorubredoxin
MKIGIIVHSQTGNTFEVAKKIHEKLISKGKDVELIRMVTLGDVEKMTKQIELDHLPTTEQFDALIFGGWIQAFSLYPGMTMYLQQLPSLKDKQITCFLTQHFPFKWMGGTMGLSKMKKIINTKGGKVIASGIVNWSRKKTLETQIETVANIISRQYM